MRVLFLMLICSIGAVKSQELQQKGGQGGIFSLGVRSTFSLFNAHEDESNGLGLGGQFRIQFADQVNSDWFFDYLKSDLGDYASRTDYHIGWSVLYYPLRTPSRLQPYILAGHCFDYTEIRSNFDRDNRDDRLSSAVQAGLGVHVNLTPRLDLSFVGQYMIHLGSELDAHYENGALQFHEHGGSSMEGHLLFNVGINYKIADLW